MSRAARQNHRYKKQNKKSSSSSPGSIQDTCAHDVPDWIAPARQRTVPGMMVRNQLDEHSRFCLHNAPER